MIINKRIILNKININYINLIKSILTINIKIILVKNIKNNLRIITNKQILIKINLTNIQN